jgi:hypothetical protein
MDPVNTPCHYTSAEAALDHIIPAGRLRMSPYARMRDPLENRELTFVGSLPLDHKPEELVLEELTDLMDDATLRIRRIRNRMLLLSFTVDATVGYNDGDEPFMRAWARARMWEQYASNHERLAAGYEDHGGPGERPGLPPGLLRRGRPRPRRAQRRGRQPQSLSHGRRRRTPHLPRGPRRPRRIPTRTAPRCTRTSTARTRCSPRLSRGRRSSSTARAGRGAAGRRPYGRCLRGSGGAPPGRCRPVRPDPCTARRTPP